MFEIKDYKVEKHYAEFLMVKSTYNNVLHQTKDQAINLNPQMKNEIIEKYLECLITNKRILKLILIIFYNYYNYSFPIVANVYKNTHFSIHNGNYICYPNISFGTNALNFFSYFL